MSAMPKRALDAAIFIEIRDWRKKKRKEFFAIPTKQAQD
jgi:hypothetical protein